MNRSLFRHIQNSFTLRLILVFIGATLCTALGLSYYLYSAARHELQNDLVKHGQSMARMLADSSRLGVFTGDLEDLLAPANSVYDNENTKKVCIYDWDGTLLVNLGAYGDADTGALSSQAIYERILKSGQPDTAFYPEQADIVFSQAIFPGETYSEEDLFFPEEPTGSVSQSRDDRQPIGYAAVVISTEGVEANAGNILRRNLLAALVVVLVSSAAIFLLVRRMTKPLKTLAEEIVRKRPGDLENGREIFFDDFNTMIDIIREAYRTIAELKANLEEKVRARTAELFDSNVALGEQKTILQRTNTQLVNTLDELKATHDKLIQSEKMAALGQLIGGLSHEINNALTFILGALPLLENNLAGEGSRSAFHFDDGQTWDDRNRELLENINEGVLRISTLTRDLRVFSYNNPHDYSLENIHTGLVASIGIIRSKYGKQIVINEQFAPDLPEISCNIGQLNQVFMNLLLNAAQAIHDEGVITVKTSWDKMTVRIAISDNGAGIAPENYDEIFNPFYTTKKVGEGSGLGLSISYTIITRHGGTIDVKSKPGEGTTFEITLPR
jgi:signal transduction histidine kinase